jgi:hypothetical protein
MIGDRLAAFHSKKLLRQLLDEWRVLQEAKDLSNVRNVSDSSQAF